MNFQDIILTLQNYWAAQGCNLIQPYDVEMGAGTFHPGTFFGALGPKPVSIAYPQPCRRPKDGRYGENPNRLQHYYQFQVLIKPSPENIQNLYLKSLQAIGIEIEKHDIRFVEDDWESPTLGAWGLGWEVWLDGMEISQFTYFRQLKWNDSTLYEELFFAKEVEYSEYNFSAADTGLLFSLFQNYEKECRELLAKALVYPAYDNLLRCSHNFNLLDARGVISVTERAAYIGRIRNLARETASAYLEKYARQ